MDTMRERFGTVVSELLDTHERVAVILADIGVARLAETGALERHPERVINVGIREQLMVGVASGIALEGWRPIVHSYTPFLLERPFEQVKLDLGHQGVGAVLVSVGASYDAAAEGRTHQAPEDVALLGTLPDWTIHVPGHPDELETLLRGVVGSDEKVYIRLAQHMNREAVPIEGGRMIAVRRGSTAAATVIAVGPMLDRALAATEDLDVSVLYATTVRPFDEETLRVTFGSPEVVLVEPYLAGTSAAEVTRALEQAPHRLLSIGFPLVESRRYGIADDHDAAHGLDAAGIGERIRDFLGRKSG